MATRGYLALSEAKALIGSRIHYWLLDAYRNPTAHIYGLLVGLAGNTRRGSRSWAYRIQEVDGHVAVLSREGQIEVANV